jgi:hypothetical protein
LARCPNLDAWSGGDWSLGVPNPLEALELLAELRDAGEAVLVEWPRGGKIGLRPRLRSKGLRLKVTEDRQWFDVGGDVRTDDGLVVEFKDLLAGGGLGRFIRLADGDWVELEAQLHRQVEHLLAVSDPTAAGRRVTPLALASTSSSTKRSPGPARPWKPGGAGGRSASPPTWAYPRA